MPSLSLPPLKSGAFSQVQSMAQPPLATDADRHGRSLRDLETVEVVRPTVVAVPRRYVRIPLAAASTGYSAEAIKQKITEGAWRSGREYIRAPDNHILIDLEGYERWATGQGV
jgi:hypothetical protein